MNGRQACMITGCSRKELRQLPHIRSVGGRYADGGQLCRDRRTLWDREAVLLMQTTTTTTSTTTITAATTTTPSLEKCDRRCNDPRRFMAIVPAPYFQAPFRVAHWGLYCVGCSESHERKTYFRKQYTKQGFVDHYCALWRCRSWKGRRPTKTCTT